jgi:hypothetical protein
VFAASYFAAREVGYAFVSRVGWMFGVDLELGSSTLRLWIAAGAAALLVAICAMALTRLRGSAASDVARAGVIALAAILGAAATWASLGHFAARDHDADRRTLETRAQDLSARALAPGSALACLDAVAGNNVDAACEKALFASPAAVAAATSYAAARLELVTAMVAYVKGGGTGIDGLLLPLRHAVELDSYGFLAHALAVRDGCTSANCKALDVLQDASRVRTNLSEQTLDHYLDHYLLAWAQPPDPPAADAAAATAAQPGAPGQPRKVVVNIDFPTSASIPAVSIMNPEPGTKGAPAAAGAANNPKASAAAAANAAPAKKPRKPAVANQANQPAPAPVAASQTLSADGQADPVWTPAPPAPPAQAAATANAPAANFASPR